MYVLYYEYIKCWHHLSVNIIQEEKKTNFDYIIYIKLAYLNNKISESIM